MAQHGIPFEVVPGITSAVACATYAGIPLTHRNLSSSVTFLTGHKADDGDLDTIPWESIVSLGHGTIVIYMGFYNLEKIATSLVRHGMDPRTNVAVIEWGTLPRQRSCVGTLETIAGLTREKKFIAPCIIVIGKVVSLRHELGWFESRPLFGKKIVTTRTCGQSTGLRIKLEALGAEVLEFPTIRIGPPAAWEAIDRALGALQTYDWVIFSSPNGVHTFFERLKALRLDARALAQTRVAVVGPQTAGEVQKYGVRADLIPTRFETQALLEAFQKKPSLVKNKKMLLVQAAIAKPDLERGLKKLDAAVVRLAAYRTSLPKLVSPALKTAILKGSVDAVTFTSGSTVEHFAKILGKANARSLSRKAVFASIGPVTSAALKKNKLRLGCEAKTFTIDGLIKTLAEKL